MPLMDGVESAAILVEPSPRKSGRSRYGRPAEELVQDLDRGHSVSIEENYLVVEV